MRILSALLLLSSCFEREAPKANNVYNELQAKAVETLPLTQQAFMQDCYLSNNYRNFGECLSSASKLGLSNCSQGKTSVGDIAVGTALGVGATKVLMGK